MVKRFGFAALVAVAAGLSATFALAEDGHHGGHGHGHHDGHGHGHHDGSSFGIHFGGGGVGIHYDDDDHDDFGHHRHHSDWDHSGWQFVVPYYDRQYYGTYYRDGGINYYVPRTYATGPGVAAEAVQIEFGGYAHVDDLSGRLERLVNELCLDLHYNYRHNQGFAETYRVAYEILKTAKYIHDKEHQGDRAEVARRLEVADGQFHQVQKDVARWSRRNRRQIGQGGAQTKLQPIEATLHYLMHDVGVTGSHGASESAAAPTDVEVAPPPAE